MIQYLDKNFCAPDWSAKKPQHGSGANNCYFETGHQVHSSAIFPIAIEIGNLSMPESWCQRTPVRPLVQTVRKGKGQFCKEENVALLERATGVVPVKVSFVWLTSRKTYFLALSRSSSSLPLGMFRQERRLSVSPVSTLSEHSGAPNENKVQNHLT